MFCNIQYKNYNISVSKEEKVSLKIWHQYLCRLSVSSQHFISEFLLLQVLQLS